MIKNLATNHIIPEVNTVNSEANKRNLKLTNDSKLNQAQGKGKMNWAIPFIINQATLIIQHQLP